MKPKTTNIYRERKKGGYGKRDKANASRSDAKMKSSLKEYDKNKGRRLLEAPRRVA